MHVATKICVITDILTSSRDECTQLSTDLQEKTKAVELLMSENQELKKQLEEMTVKAKNAEAENRMLVDRWMLQKMQDAERLNEVNLIMQFIVLKLVPESRLFESMLHFEWQPYFSSNYIAV